VERCIIETELGDIEVELYPEKAPLTVANFLRYVDSNYYENSSFFRTCTPENEEDREIIIQVIQGGNVPDSLQFAAIKLETTQETGVLHENGTISTARAEPNTATSEFFICINNQPELDFAGKRNPDGQGFAAFGKVVKGMDIVKNIQAKKNTEQFLENPVKIISIKRK
ncbi:MAG: peptidylprolyl isomerase, partial [Bacteroidota bacterium]|nr:peptidylprolyl isomerase [Bacteroidota bacterium]